MEKNKIFIGVIGGALLLAALGSMLSSEDDHGNGHMFEVSFDHEDGQHRSRSGNKTTILHNGKTMKCDPETGTVVIERDDGSKTTVTCD